MEIQSPLSLEAPCSVHCCAYATALPHAKDLSRGQLAKGNVLLYSSRLLAGKVAIEGLLLHTL